MRHLVRWGRFDVIARPRTRNLGKPARYAARAVVPLRGVRGQLAEDKHRCMLAWFELELISEALELVAESVPAAVLDEVDAPLGTRLLALRELAQVIECLLQQLPHRRFVKRQVALAQRDADLAHLLMWVRAHRTARENLRLARQPAALLAVERLGHVAAARLRIGAVLQHRPLHHVVFVTRQLKAVGQALSELVHQHRVGQRGEWVEAAGARIELEATTSPREPRPKLVGMPDADARRGERAHVGRAELRRLRHGDVRFEAHLRVHCGGAVSRRAAAEVVAPPRGLRGRLLDGRIDFDLVVRHRDGDRAGPWQKHLLRGEAQPREHLEALRHCQEEHDRPRSCLGLGKRL